MGGAVVVYLLVVAPVSRDFHKCPEAKIQPLNCLWWYPVQDLGGTGKTEDF